MNWLIPSVISALTASIILTVIYAFLFKKYKNIFWLIWTGSWFIYSLRFVFVLTSFYFENNQALSILIHASTLISGVLLLRGVYDFTETKFPTLWWGLTVIIVSWLIFTILNSYSSLVVTSPLFLFSGIVFIWAGILFVRQHKAETRIKYVIGIAFILWGIHKFDYPFVRSIDFLAPWGFLLAASFSLIIAVSTLILYFEIEHKSLLESKERFRKMFNDHSAIMLLIDPESGAITDANIGAQKFYGYSHQQLCSLRIQEINQLSNDEMAKERQNALNEERKYFIFPHKLMNGQIRTVEVHSTTMEINKEKVLFSIIHDITERKLAEQKFRQNQYYLTKAQEIGRIGTWKLDLIKNELIWTEQSYINFGVPLGTPLTYEMFLECIHPDDRDYVNEEWMAAIKGKPYDIEHRLIVDDKVIWVREKAEVEFDDNNKAISAIGFTQDITERKQVQEALHQSLEMMRNSQSVAHICSYSTKLNISEIEKSAWVCSPEFYKIFGIDKTYPHTIEGWANFIHPAYRKEVFEYHESVVKERKIFNREYKIIRINDGVERWVHGTGKLEFDDEGNPTRMHGAIQDITERKQAEDALQQSEEKFRTYFNQSPIGIELYDAAGFQTAANKASLSMFGISDITELKAFNLFDGTSLSSENKEKLHRGESVSYQSTFDFDRIKELKQYHTNRSGKAYFDYLITPLWNSGSKSLLGYMLQVQDITERKKAEKRVLESERLSAVGELASGVAHDFNNALQGMLGNLELALNDNVSPRTKKFLETAIKSANDAASRVSILQRAVKRKTTQNQFYSINLNDVIDDSIAQTRALWKDQAEKEGLAIDIKTDYEEDVTIEGNAEELRSVLYNIIKNSVQAMPEGGTISISTRRDGKQVYLSISDTGIGMDEETSKKIFQPFFTTKGFDQGTGLGMFGTFKLIKEHKGTISVKRSELGKGTEIELMLPYCELKKSIEEKKKKYMGSAKILWVDDDEMIRDNMKEFVLMMGHEIDVASSGKEALELLAVKEYDLMITDIGMPQMSGWQLAEQIKGKHPGMKIAVVTGWGDDIEAEQKTKYGVGYVLTKPVRLEQINDLIGEVLQMKTY